MQGNRLVVFGCGGHARSVLDVVLFNKDFRKIVFVDECAEENEKILDFDVLKSREVGEEAVFVALGDNKKRAELCQKYYKNLVSIISKNAYMGESIEVGKGVFVAHGAHIGVFSKIEDFALINTNASLDHGCLVQKASSVAPCATLCGKVSIGQNCLVGAGATIVEDKKIADNTIVGAGAVVVCDILQSGTYAGTPARRIK